MKNLSLVFLLFFVSSSFAASAEIVTYETHVAVQDNLVKIVGQEAGEQFGASFATGDFNNDNIEDIVVGSPFGSSSLKEWNGKVSIIFGSKSFQSSNVDLAVTPADISFYGDRAGDQLGSSITVGDFNNDGYDDIAIGAHNALIDESRIGKVYLVYGSDWGKRSYDFGSNDPDVLFVGRGAGDNFGMELHSADINNDSLDDLLIGAPGALGQDNTQTGAVYAFFGLKSGFEANFYNVGSSLADVNFYGHQTGERFGSVIETGHVTSNEKIDLLIGAYKADVGDLSDAGSIYLYKGRNNYLKTIKSATSTVSGSDKNAWFGFDIQVGDMNGDEREDIAVSAFPYLTYNRTGKVFAFYGGNVFGHDGSNYTSDQYDILVDSPVGELFLGSSLTLGDFDGDNVEDLFMGAPGIGQPNSSEAGNVYGIYSQEGEFDHNYSIRSKNIGSTVYGLNADDWFGYKMTSLDFNADGFLDLAIGARYADGDNSNNNGKIFILLGDDNPFGMPQTIASPGDRYITRAEFVAMVLESFNLKEKNADYIDQCHKYMDFCLFNFTAMSHYDGIIVDPANLQLYPDVKREYQYYDDINLATLLGLINGFMQEYESPFKPEMELSRIQALKIILSANELVDDKYEFEIEDVKSQLSYFEDINSEIPNMWWYPRYANFAVENGIIEDGKFFRPDDNVTYTEAAWFIEKTASYLKNKDAEA